jgi:hypothetical protein
MARQPRQQRIDVYGGFTSTGVDRTAGDKMRALAGLGQTMRESTLAIGKPIIEAKRAEEGAQAAEDAARDPVTGEVLKVPTINAAKFGSSQFKSAAQQRANEINAAAVSTYKTNIMLDIEKNMSNLSSANSSSTANFDFVSENYRKGLLKNVPPEMQPAIERFYFSEYEKNRNAIYKQETKNITESAKASYTLARDTFKKNYIDLIFDGKTEEAANLKAEFDANMMPGFLTAGAISQENFMQDEVSLADTARVEQEYGRINKEIISNDELNVDQKVAASKEYLSNFDKADLGLDREEKRELRSSIVAQFDAMEKDEIAKIQAENEATFLEQTQTAKDFDKYYLNAGISAKQQIQELERLNMGNKIDPKAYTARKRFITARQEYNSENSSETKDKMFNQIYNANELSKPQEILVALENINNNLIEEVAAGNLNDEDFRSLQAVLRNVTSAGGAEARRKVGGQFDEVRTTVQAGLPIEDWGTAYGSIYLEAMPMLEAALSELKSDAKRKDPDITDNDLDRIVVPENLEQQIYKEVGNRVINRISQNNTNRSAQAIQRTIEKQKPTVLTDINKRKLLPVGSFFEYNGVLYEKTK